MENKIIYLILTSILIFVFGLVQFFMGIKDIDMSYNVLFLKTILNFDIDLCDKYVFKDECVRVIPDLYVKGLRFVLISFFMFFIYFCISMYLILKKYGGKQKRI